jgi:hypothetical protein
MSVKLFVWGCTPGLLRSLTSQAVMNKPWEKASGFDRRLKVKRNYFV